MTNAKMLQILVDGQAAIRRELKDLKKAMNSGFANMTKRIDKQPPQAN